MSSVGLAKGNSSIACCMCLLGLVEGGMEGGGEGGEGEEGRNGKEVGDRI
jgi:hypothetical protein